MILKVDNLEFRYNSSPVIRGVCFSVEEGEILAILGPNGTGKTTLLKCLNRILAPRSGSVLIDSHDIHAMAPAQRARQIGWVPQSGEATRMKVYDLVLLARKPYFRWSPSVEDHAKAEEALRLLGLEKLSMRYADELSGGEFQLVQIVRALAQDPRLILFDEPTSSLDITHQHDLMAKISALIHGSPRAAVMTMHDINLALRYADKFLLLKEGTVWAMGDRSIITPENIREVYRLNAQVVQAAGYPMVVPV